MMRSKKLSLRQVLTLGAFAVFAAGAISYGNFHRRLMATQKPTSEGEQSSFHAPNDNLERSRGRLENVTKPLNILLLYADDWRHDTLSAAGNRIVRTPSIDALARRGVRFTHNCVTTSICWISRATLYTGQYMSRHNTTKSCCWSGMPKSKVRVPTPPNWKELSIYSLLQKAGYYTGFVGKWGIYMPFLKDVDFGSEADGWHYKKIGNKTWHVTEKNEADALRFLRGRDRTKPFLLNVAFFATHAVDDNPLQYMPQNASMGWYARDHVPLPYSKNNDTNALPGNETWDSMFGWKDMPYFFTEGNEARRRWHLRYDGAEKYQRMMRNYYRMATEVDSTVGRILRELRRQGEYDNTLIIFTTDNGNFHGEKGLADKWYPHQESIRVPLVIRDPRMSANERGAVKDEFTLNIDLAPTILAAAGVQRPERMMGRDIADLYERTEYQTTSRRQTEGE